MADKGALTPGFRGCKVLGITPGPWYYSNTPKQHATDQSRNISGSNTEAGAPIAGAAVKLYWRPTGHLVGKTITDQDGSYVFTGLVGGSDQYQVVMEDKPGGTQYNDQIKSLLTPGS